MLLKSVYGLKTSGRAFGQQLSEQILSFTMKVKCPKTVEEIEAKFTRLAVDHCIYPYEDALGRIMMLLHYVDDIVATTTDRELREAFFDHIREKWEITAEGQMNRFLEISYTWNCEFANVLFAAAVDASFAICKLTRRSPFGYTLGRIRAIQSKQYADSYFLLATYA